MKKHLLLIATVLYTCIFQSCNAMEQAPVTSYLPTKKGRPKILAKINCVEQPDCGYFLTKKKVIISGKSGCNIYNLKTDEVKNISKAQFPHLAVHPNKKLFALSCDNAVAVYTETGEEKLTHKSSSSRYFIASIFDPLDDTILLCHKNNSFIDTLNYKNCKIFVLGNGYLGQTASPTIALHPTKRILCLAKNPGFITFHNTDSFQTIQQSPIDISLFNIPQGDHIFCQFSPNGSLLVNGNRKGFYVSDKDGTFFNLIIKPNSNKTFEEVIFHPNGDFLITLSQPDNIVSYWNINYEQLKKNDHPLDMPLEPTVKMSCSSNNDNPKVEHRHMCRYLSCDLSGKQLLVTLANECLVLPIPFEVIYQPNTKDTCAFAYFILHTYLYDQNHALPKDIVSLLVHKLLKFCKR